MGNLGRIVRRIVAPIAAVAGLALATAPAATAAPVITWLYCETGASKYHCIVEYTGAVGPVTVRWDFYTYNVHIGTDYGSFTGIRSCSANKPYSVTVTVTDSTGATQDHTGFSCNPGPWQ